jgi:hypothetical protein
MPHLAAALSVRTVAFELPTEKVTLELQLEERKKSAQLEVAVNQFGKASVLAPGSYTVTSPAFKAPCSLVLPQAGSTSYLLLVFANREGGLHVLPVADELAKFSNGDRFVLNATAEDIAVRIHQSKVMLKPGKYFQFKLPRSPLPGNRMEVEMHRFVAATWQPFNSTYWPLSADSRSIVLIYPDPATAKPRVRSLMDLPESPEEVAN